MPGAVLIGEGSRPVVECGEGHGVGVRAPMRSPLLGRACAVRATPAARRSCTLALARAGFSKSMDGVACLHDIFFEAIYKRMSHDGGEYLRYGPFPEVAKEMSKDGAEYLRRGLFPDVPKDMSRDGGEYLRHFIFPELGSTSSTSPLTCPRGCTRWTAA